MILRIGLLAYMLALLIAAPLWIPGILLAWLLLPQQLKSWFDAASAAADTCFKRTPTIQIPRLQDLDAQYEHDLHQHAQMVVRALMCNLHTHPDWIERRDGAVRVRTHMDPSMMNLSEEIKKRAAKIILNSGHWHHVDMSDELGVVFLERRES